MSWMTRCDEDGEGKGVCECDGHDAAFDDDHLLLPSQSESAMRRAAALCCWHEEWRALLAPTLLTLNLKNVPSLEPKDTQADVHGIVVRLCFMSV